jgi:hypothetical protein
LRTKDARKAGVVGGRQAVADGVVWKLDRLPVVDAVVLVQIGTLRLGLAGVAVLNPRAVLGFCVLPEQLAQPCLAKLVVQRAGGL